MKGNTMKKHWTNDRATEKAKDDELVERIKAGGTLTKSELAYCATNWSPIKQAINLGRYAKTNRGTK